LNFLDVLAEGNQLELMQKAHQSSRFIAIVARPPLGEETKMQDGKGGGDHEHRALRELDRDRRVELIWQTVEFQDR
jgi:hypothetical protein